FGEYGFTAMHLILTGVTANGQVIFKLDGTDAKNNFENIFLHAAAGYPLVNLSRIGQMDQWPFYVVPSSRSQPECLFVFD
ncbi:MAG: hypothetical protein ACHQM6_06740, partial [Candidatus Kapaibacterium sp.]